MKKLLVLAAASLGLAAVGSSPQPTPVEQGPTTSSTTAQREAPSKRQTSKPAESATQATAPVQRQWRRKPRRTAGGAIYNQPRRCRYGKARWVMMG
ncbi:hypothetical protein [Hymenobacter saemangeumensis]|uniref:hypothetical protein n=1 Tax=Hymenobacter saemangeumensis TaxID=1084522 RepID=UPI0031EC4103